MLVSFIIVTFNEARVLPDVVKALDQLQRPEGFSIEIIAVDGGSHDGTPDAARASGCTRVVEMPGASIPVCRNRGIAEARGTWLAFVDGDCVLHPDWLMHAARLMTRHAELVLGWPASPPSPGTRVQRAWHVHWMHKNPSQDLEHGEPVVKNGGFRMITTRNMIMHRAVAERIGGFDETLATGEDTDFVFRATMAGIPAWGLPSLGAIHLGEPATFRKFFRQQLWHANRKAYKTIMAKSGMKAGGNAPLFTAIYLVLAVLGIAGLAGGWFHPVFFLALTPLPALLLALATRTCLRARQPELLLTLAALYGAYGLARVIDLAGLAPRKPSWKVPAKKRVL